MLAILTGLPSTWYSQIKMKIGTMANSNKGNQEIDVLLINVSSDLSNQMIYY